MLKTGRRGRCGNAGGVRHHIRAFEYKDQRDNIGNDSDPTAAENRAGRYFGTLSSSRPWV